MDDTEKLYALKIEVMETGTDNDTTLLRFIAKANAAFDDLKFPFQNRPTNYINTASDDEIIISIAKEFYLKMGAEGQTLHSELGVNRRYENADISNSLKKRIVPFGFVPQKSMGGGG